MYLAYTPEEEALRTELRAYFATIMTPEVEAEVANGDTGGPHCLAAAKKMGHDGWLGIGWPKEYGGQGRGLVDQFIFYDEAWRALAPIPALTINAIAQTIMAYGSEEQKRFFLPRILKGELHFAVGYTEPQAGTDLASLKTRAVRDGDDWVITGQKIYTSLAAYADYIWLAARTDPDAPKHQGISIFAVPTTTPGFSYSTIHTLVSSGTTNTFYDNLRVPASALIGKVNKGWKLITNQLNYERVAIAPPGMVDKVYQDTVTWARATRLPDGRRVIDQDWVRTSLARVHAQARVSEARQLEGRHLRRAQPGHLEHDQSLRQRVLLRGLPPPAGDLRPRRHAAERRARSAAPRPARARLPGHPLPDLRRRRQRGAARPHRALRPRHAARAAALGPGPRPWTSSSTRTNDRSRT